MLIFMLILTILLGVHFTIDIIHTHKTEQAIQSWENNKEKHNHFLTWFKEEWVWKRLLQEARTAHIKRTKRVDMPVWHDQMAQQLLVGGVWAHSIYQQRTRIMLGLTDPADLDPRKLPRMTSAVDMAQGVRVITVGAGLLATCVEKLQEWFFTAKWNTQQAYYRYRSERARDVTPKRVVYLDSTTAGGTTSTALVPASTYHTITI